MLMRMPPAAQSACPHGCRGQSSHQASANAHAQLLPGPDPYGCRGDPAHSVLPDLKFLISLRLPLLSSFHVHPSAAPAAEPLIIFLSLSYFIQENLTGFSSSNNAQHPTLPTNWPSRQPSLKWAEMLLSLTMTTDSLLVPVPT